MEKLALLKVTEENIAQLIKLNHIELKVVVYFILIQKNSLINLTTDARITLCDNLTITTQKLSSTLTSLINKKIIIKEDKKKFVFNIDITFTESYNDAVQVIYNKKYFKDESSI